MAGQFLFTLPDPAVIPTMVKGKFIKGHREPRIAMVGRSNVGKSSLINAMLGTQGLARVSNEPGRTRAIQFFLWQDARKIVADLPGYGYAKISSAEREAWGELIQQYLRQDEGLERALVLLDSRHGPTDKDIEAIRFLSSESVPITFVFTKVDSLKNQAERARRRKEATEALRKLGYDPEGAFWVSSKTKDGMKELIRELSQSSAAPIEVK